MLNRRNLLPQIRDSRGSTLAVTLFLIMLAALSAIMMSRTVLDQARLNKRRRDLARAYYAAQCGPQLIKYWGLDDDTAAQYTPNPAMFLKGTGATTFPTLRASLNAGGFNITADTFASMQTTGLLRSDHNFDVSQLYTLQVRPLSAADTAASPMRFRVIATGQCANTTIRRHVVATFQENPSISGTASIVLDAALLSHGSAGMTGNARIHWGEAWSKQTFSVDNKSQYGYLSSDPWAKYRTEGTISFPSTWKLGVGKDLDDLTRVQPGLAPASGTYANVFYQHQTLTWPVFDYQTFKNQAIKLGRYYGTDASGNIYKGGIKDAAHMVNLLTEFGVANRDAAPYNLAFIDTVNGQPPAADGSNLATISAAGTGLGLKGVFWIGANLDANGCGSPPSVTGKDPDGATSALDKIFAEGVLYVAGTASLGGNAGVYGSIVVERGYTGGGTPDIWYNYELKNGLNYSTGPVSVVGGNFTMTMQSNY
ncbi:hypothetical protein [uncultured Desulfobulbus sp.]|uniref:pilus assembly PilX N-terminal domain-containing protein n=1 Tax=uncultured Desulfobulbus sp. TaxID=239745 RepID=UPI0029C60ED3|nr:hypothetical protein [uncultured Desulfobulbus sp.]